MIIITTVDTKTRIMDYGLSYITSKPQRKQWNDDIMMSAISAARKREMGLKTAAKLHNIPRSTLQRHVNDTSLNLKEALE
jgi:hypothetical protein